MKWTLQLYSYRGVHGACLDSILGETIRARGAMRYSHVQNDPLLTKARSRGASLFLDNEDAGDCLVMIDDDTEWRLGDAEHIAKTAVDVNAVVGAIVAVKALGLGFASDLPEQKVTLGKDELLESSKVGTGFIAIPRSVLRGVFETNPFSDIETVYDGITHYHTFFRQRIRAHSTKEGLKEWLSEDVSFCTRVAAAGFKCFVSSYPIITHHGSMGFTAEHAMMRRK